MNEIEERSTTAAAEPVRVAVAPKPGDPLVRRELQVVRAMARGLSNAAIGVELGIATNTVKLYGRHLFAKLGVSTRIDAVAAGRRAGLVSGRCPMCGHGSPSTPRATPTAAAPPHTGLRGAPGAPGGPR